MADTATTYAALILADEGIEITAEKINTLVSAAKIEIEPIWATLLAKVCFYVTHSDNLSTYDVCFGLIHFI